MGRERRVVILSSAEEMLDFGRSMGASLAPGEVLALSGDLGSGKTTFTQGLAWGMGIDHPIQSPTFVYCNQYEGTCSLIHFDLYRMKGPQDFLGMGFEEHFNKDSICVIEWPERIDSILPPKTWRLAFSHHPQGRQVVVCAP